MYLLLQSCRYYGFLAVTPINLIGASLLCSHILAESINYFVSGYSGDNESRDNGDDQLKQVSEKLWRWSIFIFLLSAIALSNHSIALWQSWQTWTMITWCLIIKTKTDQKNTARDKTNS
jgi:hypothetical protein